MKAQKKSKLKWKNYYWFFITAPLSILGATLFVLFGHRYNYEALTGLSFVVTFSLPFTIYYLYLEINSNKWYIKLLNILILIAVILPGIFGLTKLKTLYYQSQLNDYPAKAYGNIVRYEKSSGKGGTTHYATFDYKYNDKSYTQKVGNNDAYYKIGDSLTLKISSEDPEIFHIIDVRRTSNP